MAAAGSRVMGGGVVAFEIRLFYLLMILFTPWAHFNAYTANKGCNIWNFAEYVTHLMYAFLEVNSL
ncbi:hypothetical protein DSCO28_45350 [Desulfosarcina ovata subsp. sediminis]|uniref:Uncharacterized protein n=1 Tax=Desulfosarcina ovata subsp. sediminis TaxID=885957 RepID=A0A5K7ZUS1_9BACT|nr:hypothetical protein DSCO28_45350 [Desulfosarcina ovata subsp. sediminis]